MNTSDFQSSSQTTTELYWVIKRKANGNLKVASCRAEDGEIDIVDSDFEFEGITYTIVSDDDIRAEVSQRNSEQYIYATIQLARINKSIDPIGYVSVDWQNTGKDSSSMVDIYCAEFNEVMSTNSNGSNIQEKNVIVGTSDSYVHLSSRSGTDTYEYIKVDYGNNNLDGFDYNGFDEMNINYDKNSDDGFSADFIQERIMPSYQVIFMLV